MAARFWVGGTGNWGDAGLAHWSLTTGGAPGQAVPTSSDAVTLDGNSGASVITLDTSSRVCASLTVNGFTGTLTFTQQLSVSGSITFTTTSFTLSGVNQLRMIAAGTWTTNGKTVAVPVEIGATTTFTCTLAGDLTVSGSMILSNTTSTIFSGAFNIILTGGASDMTIQGSQTVTLSGNITVPDTVAIADACVVNGAFSVTCGSLQTIGALTGTATIKFSGGGSWLGSTGACSTSMSVDGDTTLSGTCLYSASGTPTMTVNTGGLTGSGVVSIASACTIVGHATNGISNITLTAAITLTINTNALIMSGTFTFPNAAVTLAGTAGLNAETWANTAITASRTWTLTQGNTYTCGTAWNLTGLSAAAAGTLVSSHGTNKVTLTLGLDATQDSVFLNYTRIDASAGQCVFSAKGTITTSFNVANSLASSNILNEGGGEALTVTGVTYDNAGAILGSCDVYLMRDNGNSTATFIQATVSNASTGVYSFTCFPGSTYFTVAWKEGSPDVFDVTDRELVAA